MTIATHIKNREQIRLKALHPLSVYAVTALFYFFPWTTLVPVHHTDAELEKIFHANESDFRLLIEMSNMDSQIVRITQTFTGLKTNSAWPRSPTLLGFSDDRWNEYRKLFDKIGSKHGIDRNDTSIFVIMTSADIGTGGSDKGYVFTMSQPYPMIPLRSSIDSIPIKMTSYVPVIVYKKLNDNWYLFYRMR